MSLKHTPDELVKYLELHPAIKVVFESLGRKRNENFDYMNRIQKLLKRSVPGRTIIIEPMWDNYYAVRFASKSGTIVAITDGMYVAYHSLFLDQKEQSTIPLDVDLATLSRLIHHFARLYEEPPRFEIIAQPTNANHRKVA